MVDNREVENNQEHFSYGTDNASKSFRSQKMKKLVSFDGKYMRKRGLKPNLKQIREYFYLVSFDIYFTVSVECRGDKKQLFITKLIVSLLFIMR